MKKFCFVLAVLCFLNVSVFANGVDDVLDPDMQDNIINSFEASGVEFDALETIDKLNRGDFDIGFGGIINQVKSIARDLLKENLGFGITLFALIMLASVIINVNESFSEEKPVNLVVLAVVVVSMLGTVNKVCEYTTQFVDNLILFVNAYIPTIMMLLASSGKVGTAGVLNPVMIAFSSVIILIVKNFIIPLNIISFVLKLAGCITEKQHLKNFGEQIQKILKWLLGFIVTIYVGIIAIVGVAAPKVDDMTLKTAKYAISNFIPYVGGMVADSVDLIFACSSVVKNSVGIAGLIVILLMAAVPCLKVLAKLIVLNVVGFFVSPVAGKNIIESLNNMSSCIGVFFAVNIILSVMYIISITVIIFIGGA